MFFFIKIFGLSGFFDLDLRQYRIKSALFTSRNPDFPALPHCCVFKCTDWSLRKDSAAFRRNTKVLTITNSPTELS